MNRHRFFFVCNAFDDRTRTEREIVTDSPAASRKIFKLSGALRKTGVRATVISMGRGKQNGSRAYFPGKIVRVDGVPIIYLPFVHFPVLSELLSLLAFLPVIWRLRRKHGKKTALFYNRLSAYLPALWLSRLLNFNTALDLEDGATTVQGMSLPALKARLLRRMFDACCTGGALLACDALAEATSLRPVQSCYGTADIALPKEEWMTASSTFLFGGTVSADTGGLLLISAIKKIRATAPAWASRLCIEVTGKGDCLDLLKELSHDETAPTVTVHGRTTDVQYRQILERARVGLALKPNDGALANTTFPSKVIEFASNDILVLSTDISDVRKVLGDGAVYLETDDVDLLIEKFRWIIENGRTARSIALAGMKAAEAACSEENVGHMLNEFLFPQPPRSVA